MKYYNIGTRKSVDKKGKVIEVTSIIPVKNFIQKCKEQECNNNRANGSSRCSAHNKNAKIAKDFAIPNAKQ